MARCEDCLHYRLCVNIESQHLRIILAGDKAERCRCFESAADVAPKSEVAREIFEEICEYAEQQIEALSIAEKVDTSGADFFGGGKQAFVLLLDRIAELKKKYTEEQI